MISKIIYKLWHNFFPSELDRMVKKWYADGGDYEFRFAYNLTKDSMVLDLGGYQGQWASDIFSRYCCKIIIFEPVSEYAKQISKRFACNEKIQVLQCGLGGRAREDIISISGDGSSMFGNANIKESIQIIDVASWIREQNITSIDLMKINIEGGEYELLDRLIETDLIGIVKNLQVQFHNISRNSTVHMELIQERLHRTHSLTYQYKFVWENWARKAIRNAS
ncbi:MAG TPA: FkbM family methyltransferase [Candidatus Brocadiaceae bacterium]|nr:FkbM family methyltransferase [Candidatus Woesearchaeota archaeon]